MDTHTPQKYQRMISPTVTPVDPCLQFLAKQSWTLRDFTIPKFEFTVHANLSFACIRLAGTIQHVHTCIHVYRTLCVTFQ